MSGFMVFGGKSRFTIIDSPEMDREKMLFYLEKQLKYERARNVVRRGDLVFFSGNIFTFVRIRQFVQVGDRGFIRVTTEAGKLVVMYRLSFVWIFFLYLAGVLFLASMLIKDNSVVNTFLSALALFCTVFGFIVFSSLVSFAMFIDRTFDSFMRK
jgi:hypothetical protein